MDDSFPRGYQIAQKGSQATAGTKFRGCSDRNHGHDHNPVWPGLCQLFCRWELIRGLPCFSRLAVPCSLGGWVPEPEPRVVLNLG
jgi:hypothetical protein